ncbi:hypothetical protein [Streptomyces sp. NPDC102437]|uniref:hypothetical protein n=1 Tax=Streptomyces sp. NPDC102437 TaxID=3366175 RepID=UPI003813FD34
MTPPALELTLPEELLLRALDPQRGKPQCSGRSLSYGRRARCCGNWSSRATVHRNVRQDRANRNGRSRHSGGGGSGDG